MLCLLLLPLILILNIIIIIIIIIILILLLFLMLVCSSSSSSSCSSCSFFPLLSPVVDRSVIVIVVAVVRSPMCDTAELRDREAWQNTAEILLECG